MSPITSDEEPMNNGNLLYNNPLLIRPKVKRSSKIIKIGTELGKRPKRPKR